MSPKRKADLEDNLKLAEAMSKSAAEAVKKAKTDVRQREKGLTAAKREVAKALRAKERARAIKLHLQEQISKCNPKGLNPGDPLLVLLPGKARPVRRILIDYKDNRKKEVIVRNGPRGPVEAHPCSDWHAIPTQEDGKKEEEEVGSL